jgi:hypothetical protein
MFFSKHVKTEGFKKEKGLKIHRSRIHGLMSQSFSSKSFSSEINETTRKSEEINNTPFNSTDYEKQFKYEPLLRDEHIYH